VWEDANFQGWLKAKSAEEHKEKEATVLTLQKSEKNGKPTGKISAGSLEQALVCSHFRIKYFFLIFSF